MKNIKKRKLASIQKIRAIYQIEWSDFIELIQINNWNCIAKKWEFKEWDLAIYFEIDSFLPLIKEFKFLENWGIKKMFLDWEEIKWYRLKTKKIRWVISQWLALPLWTFKIEWKIWEDVWEKIWVYKYEMPVSIWMEGKQKWMFPWFIQRTDEERIQNIWEKLKKYKNEEFIATEKIDWTSSTFFLKDWEYWVCWRNIEFTLDSKTLYTRISEKYNIESKLKHLWKNLAIQAEIAGNWINWNILKINDVQLFVFNIYDIDKSEYLWFEEFEKLIKILELPIAPIVFKWKLPNTFEKIMELADEPSFLNKKLKKEWLVFKTKKEIKDIELWRVSFKVISNKFLLK